eukprot:snap_masked-scaffold_97-processed-gene-0.7-mRNA-1 protein AED:1.00 eAED:1.00 QI:0/0/0/0/1/1/2/0/360
MLSTHYGSAGKLFLNDGSFLQSSSGVRQGDPLGPLLFSISLSKIILRLQETLPKEEIFTYLDDLVIVSKASQESDLIKKVEEVFESFQDSSHLKLSPEKTKIFPNPNKNDFLGSTLATNETFLKKHLDEFNSKLERLKLLHHQDAFYLLRTCVLPQLIFFLRTTSINSDQSQALHNSICSFISYFTSKFSFTSFNPDLLHLPIRNGGLGLMSPNLVSKNGLNASKELSERQMECENFLSDLGIIKQCGRLKNSYKEMIANAFQTLNEFEKLSFTENCTEIASKWMHTLPVETKTTIFNADFCAALCSRLLLTPRCKNDCSRERITHFEQCSCFSQMKVSRHESIKKILADFLEVPALQLP